MRILLEKSNQLINNSKQPGSELLDLFQAIIFQNMLPQQAEAIQEDNSAKKEVAAQGEDASQVETVDDLLQQVVVSYMLAKDLPQQPPAESQPATPQELVTADNSVMQNAKVITTRDGKLTVPDEEALLDDSTVIADDEKRMPEKPDNGKLTVEYKTATVKDKPRINVSTPVQHQARQDREKTVATREHIESCVNQWMQGVNVAATQSKPLVVQPNEVARQSEETPVTLHMESVVVSKPRQEGGKDVYLAHIKIHPAELGPIEGRIHVVKDKVQITLVVKQAGIEDMMKNHVDTLIQQFTTQKMQVESIIIQTEPTALTADNQSFQEQSHSNRYQPLEDQGDRAEPAKAKPAKSESEQSKLVDTYI